MTAQRLLTAGHRACPSRRRPGRGPPALHEPNRRETRLAAIVHDMFGIFHGDVLIGRSGLESGDPPMGVAFGQFEPTDAFAPLRKTMKRGRDGSGKELRDTLRVFAQDRGTESRLFVRTLKFASTAKLTIRLRG